MKEVGTSLYSVNGLRPKIVKGEQNLLVHSNIDANKMAEFQANRQREEELLKKQKIQSFMNNTKLNASKLYKEQCSKNLQQIQGKKQILQKQKELKQKYTILPKKSGRPQTTESIMRPVRQQSHVNWKQAEDANIKVHIPVQNCEVEDSSGNESGYGSEIQKQKNQTPSQVVSQLSEIRKRMGERAKKQ